MWKTAGALGSSCTIFLCQRLLRTRSILRSLAWNFMLKTGEYSQPSLASCSARIYNHEENQNKFTPKSVPLSVRTILKGLGFDGRLVLFASVMIGAAWRVCPSFTILGQNRSILPVPVPFSRLSPAPCFGPIFFADTSDMSFLLVHNHQMWLPLCTQNLKDEKWKIYELHSQRQGTPHTEHSCSAALRREISATL